MFNLPIEVSGQGGVMGLVFKLISVWLIFVSIQKVAAVELPYYPIEKMQEQLPHTVSIVFNDES